MIGISQLDRKSVPHKFWRRVDSVSRFDNFNVNLGKRRIMRVSGLVLNSSGDTPIGHNKIPNKIPNTF